MTPAIPLTDKRFVYVPAAKSDIRLTFERVRAELERNAIATQVAKEKT